MSNLRAGVAVREITPPVGVDLTGYGGRPSGCTSIHDPLYARALVLAEGAATVALVSLDVLGISFALRDRLREHAATVGIPASGLVLNASHTHAGPVTQHLRGLGEPNDACVERFFTLTCEAMTEAARSVQPASLSTGRAAVRIGHNRRQHLVDGRTVIGRNRTGAIVPHADILQVRRRDGSPLATWFAHACHPTTLGGSNLAVSGEFPGVAARAVEEMGAGVGLFAQGCCGDINPTAAGTFDAVAQNGRTLATAVVDATASLRDVEAPTLCSHLEVARLSLQPPPPRDVLEARIEEYQAAADDGARDCVDQGKQGMLDAPLQWTRAVHDVAYANGPAPTTLAVEVQALRIGDVGLITMPGDVFADVGNRIEAASPFRQTTALAYTNGCHGYVPTAGAYAEGGYEVDDAIRYYGSLMFAPASEGELLAAAVRALHSVAA